MARFTEIELFKIDGAPSDFIKSNEEHVQQRTDNQTKIYHGIRKEYLNRGMSKKKAETLAIWALGMMVQETGHFQKAVGNFNYGNIKLKTSEQEAYVKMTDEQKNSFAVSKNVWEDRADGTATTEDSLFKNYKSEKDFFKAFADWQELNSPSALSATTPEDFIDSMDESGYFTDTQYKRKFLDIVGRRGQYNSQSKEFLGGQDSVYAETRGDQTYKKDGSVKTVNENKQIEITGLTQYLDTRTNADKINFDINDLVNNNVDWNNPDFDINMDVVSLDESKTYSEKLKQSLQSTTNNLSTDMFDPAMDLVNTESPFEPNEIDIKLTE